MTLYQLIGPFLLAQAVLLHQLERRAGAILRPRRSDYAAFGTALGWLGVLLCGVTLVTALLDMDLRMTALAVASLAVAGWWLASRRQRRFEPHLDDVEARPHEVIESGGVSVRVRLGDAGDVGGIVWPAGTILLFGHGWLREAVPPDSFFLSGYSVAGGEPVKFDEAGRIRQLVVESDVAVGRLPRGATETRGAELVARAGTALDPRQLRDIVLAKSTHIRGVLVPAGSVVSAFHGVRVELAAETEVFGERIEKGARLRFGEAGGLMSLFRRSPAVRVTLMPKEGYRTGGERRTIALFEDGSVDAGRLDGGLAEGGVEGGSVVEDDSAPEDERIEDTSREPSAGVQRMRAK